jgi:ParB family chromosome partitioning protein
VASHLSPVLAEIISIPVSEIEIGERLRPVDRKWATALGGIMAAEGQKTAIEVCRLPGRSKYLLVSGGHRLVGAQIAKIASIHAVVVSADAAERREREISENLWRLELGPIDRAAFIADLVLVFKEREGIDPAQSPQSIAAQARWKKTAKADAADACHQFSRAYGWAGEVAAQIGLSTKTVYADLALYRGLLPDVAASLRGHPVASVGGQLRTLAKLSSEDQRAVCGLILAGDAKAVADAVSILKQKKKPTAEDRAWSAFFGSWSRMSGAMRRAALTELRAQGLPRGVTITFTGESDA